MKKIFLIIFLALLLISISGKVIADTCTSDMCPNGERISSCCPTEGLVPCGTTCCSCQFCDLFVMFDGILDFVLFKIVLPVAALLLVIGGIMFFSYAENPKKVDDAKRLLTSVVIGLVIIFAAWLIITTFFKFIGVSEIGPLKKLFTDPTKWAEIECQIQLPK